MVHSAHNVISSLYSNWFYLQKYIRQARIDGIQLIQVGDPAEYSRLVESTIVAVPHNQSTKPPFQPIHTQWFTLREIINRVIEHCCHSNKANVLVFGFERLSSSDKVGHGPVAGTLGIQNSYPNTIVSYLRTSKAWQLLHERIGDDLMIHLLQNLALFVEGASNCYFQVTGFPANRFTTISGKDLTVKSTVLEKKKREQSKNDGCSVAGKKKIQRGSKRGKGYQMNLSSSSGNKKPHASFMGIINASDGSETMQMLEMINIESDKVDSASNSTNLGRVETCKRKAISSENEAQEEPSAKKSKMPLHDVEVSPCLYPVVSDESAVESSVDKCSIYSICDRDQGDESLIEGKVEEESPLLFPEDKSLSGNLLSETSSMDNGNNVSMECVGENAQVIALKESSKVTTCALQNNQEIDVTCSTGGNNNSLKRRLFVDGDEKKNRSCKLSKKKKPWQFLLKCLPQRSKRKSVVPIERPKQMQKVESQIPKGQKVKAHKRKSQPAPKKIIQGIHLHEIYLPHTSLFYASNPSQSFPKGHILETTHMSKSGARQLVRHIFVKGLCLSNTDCEMRGVKKEIRNVKNLTGTTSSRKQSGNHKERQLPRRLKCMEGIFLNFLRRHKKCPFRTLLRHHCFFALGWKKEQQVRYYTKFFKSGKNNSSLATRTGSVSKEKVWQKCPSERVRSKVSSHSGHKKHTNLDSSTYRRAVGRYTEQSQVMNFLKCVCSKVVPNDLWGSFQNKRTFFKNLAKFVKLHKGEKFSLGQMMTGIKISSCKWLKTEECTGKRISPSYSLMEQRLLAKFIWWLVTRYLIPLLKGFFYITESGVHRQRVFYYRKPVWEKIQQFGMNIFCNEFFKPLRTKEAEELLHSKSSLGFSPLRFLPKNSTVRPITNMKHCQAKKEPSNSQKPRSINRKLQNLFEILKFEKGRNPYSLRTTLFGSDDLYQVLKPFAERVRKSSDGRLLYFVHVDVNHCYESIPHKKLFEIMEKVLDEEEYLIRRFSLLKMSGGKVHREFHKHASAADDCRSFPDFFRSLVEVKGLKQVIAVDLVWYQIEDRDKLIELLREHIFNNVVRIGNRYYRQIRGIAQGSILSTMLCGYFYSDMEKTHFAELTRDPDSLLLRWVDDFLLITPQKRLAVEFLNTMHAGIPEYGCRINHDKTLINFDAVAPNGKHVKRIAQNERFPWCGFLLDTVTLEVRSDISRYHGVQLRDTLSVPLDAHPGKALRRKLLCSVRPRCHPLLLDPDLNSRESILLTVYQSFLLTAKKFLVYAKEFPRGGQPKDSPSFFCKLFLDLAQYFHATSSRKCKQLSSSKASFSLNEGEITWLCFHAFKTLLRNKPRYEEILHFLTTGLSLIGYPSKDLRKATDSAQHAVIKEIR